VSWLKIRKHLKDCIRGDVLAEDIYIPNRNIPLAVKGNPVDDKLKEKLIDNKVFKIYVEEERVTDASTEVEVSPECSKTEKFIAQYSKDVTAIKSVFQEIASGKDPDLGMIADMSQNLLENSDDIFRVVDSINSVRGIDEYTYTHSINVALYSMFIARWMGLEEDMVNDVIKAGLLHDIGKARIPSEILNKRGPLSDIEFEKMKEHPVIGYDICNEMSGIKDSIKEAVLLHHEKADGSGYPKGLRDGEFGLYAKIVSIADIYDAITSERVYKKKQTPFETFSEIKEVAYGKLDIKISDLFLSNIASFYVGSKVRMNTGEIGEIAFIYPHKIDQPLVNIGGKMVDISKEKGYSIEELI
jgi:putative nucleotidyltransferase with HDIG domain